MTINDRIPEPLATLAEQVSRARSAADHAGAEARHETVQAAKTLTALGLSRRDTGELLGVSHQRVQQLLEAS